MKIGENFNRIVADLLLVLETWLNPSHEQQRSLLNP
jgi:hypothetical protein